MCHDGNTPLDTEEINMLVVLHMNREFIQHMREIYPKLSGQNFNGTLVKLEIKRPLQTRFTLPPDSPAPQEIMISCIISWGAGESGRAVTLGGGGVWARARTGSLSKLGGVKSLTCHLALLPLFDSLDKL